MKATTAIALLLVGGCSRVDPVADAEAEYNIAMSAKPSPVEQCQAERRLTDAYLKAHNADRYRFQKRIADQACLNAEIERRL